MKKRDIKPEVINEIIENYTIDLLSSNVLSLKFSIPKKRILVILKENNVKLRASGRIYLGGKKTSDKKYRQKNKEKVSKYYSSWVSKNKEHLKEYHRNYQKENKDYIRKTKREYEKTRKSKDPVYKLIGNFRTAIYTVLKENNMTKFGHYFEVLGYTPNDLVKHLDAQLTDGMTWENYGKWHVDHIIPISSFTFRDMYDTEFKKCWGLDNLQPMWGEENIKKYNHIL